MKIFLTGATGFVGQELLSQLVREDFTVRCLVRSGSGSRLPEYPGVEIHTGDASTLSTLNGAMNGCEAAINLIGIIREFPGRGVTFQKLHLEATENLIAAARQQGVKRYLHMSANGTRPEAVTPYHRSKWQAEEAVRGSGLDWTIFRPSLIYGPNDQFVNMLAEMVRKLPLVPVMGNGQYRMQPVSVDSVARGFVRALAMKDSIGQTYHCGGPQPLSYDRILDLIGKSLGKASVGKLHHPLLMMRPVVSVMEKFSFFPITKGQLQMLLEENCCDPDPWQRFFEIEQPSFEAGIATYLKNR